MSCSTSDPSENVVSRPNLTLSHKSAYYTVSGESLQHKFGGRYTYPDADWVLKLHLIWARVHDAIPTEEPFLPFNTYCYVLDPAPWTLQE